MGRPFKHEEHGRILGKYNFYVYENDRFQVTQKTTITGQRLTEILKKLKSVDDAYISDLVKDLVAEAAYHHYPGNPGVSLDHWHPTTPVPFSQSAQEKLENREPFGMTEIPCPECEGKNPRCFICRGVGKIGVEQK